ncbi:MAG: hypothetical protein ABEJ68_05515 [Halobacteriaceae archaeon]
MSNPAQVVRENWEKAKLVLYLGVMGVLALPLSTMLGNAWEQAVVSRVFIELFDAYLSITLEKFSVVAFGLFLGFLLLLALDQKKRIQGVMLTVGLLVALAGLSAQGLFLPNIDFAANVLWLGGGIAFGTLVGGGRRLTRVNTTEPLEFRRAARGVTLLLGAIVVVAFLEYHLKYPAFVDVRNDQLVFIVNAPGRFGLEQSNLVWHALVSGTFLVTLTRFMDYDAETDFFVLGPRGSGKSLFLVGAYLEALERAQERDEQTPMNPSDDLMSMVEELDRSTSDWIVEATAPGEIHYLQFTYIHGSVFPKNIEVTGLDYAGEYLDRLPDALTGLLENEEDDTLLALAQNVQQADTLILVIDVERFVNGEGLDIPAYFSILQACDGKEVLLVATKADILADQFREERGIEPHRYYEDFKEYVNEELRNSQQVSALIEETAGSEIHPVYYQTKTREDGSRVPMRDDRNSVMTVGYDRLLDKLGR